MFFAVVPAHNEVKTIGLVVKKLLKFVDKVVVVDDGSIDGTCISAKKNGAIVLCHKFNLGQGAALQTGHDYALTSGADYVLDFDADDQMDIFDIEPALNELKKSGADVLFGSRFLDNRSNLPWTKSKILLPISRMIDSFFTGIKLSDAHNGFRILNKKALERISITQNQMAHATEIPCLIKKNNLRYIEFPIKIVYHEYGQNAINGFVVLKDLIMGNITNKYN